MTDFVLVSLVVTGVAVWLGSAVFLSFVNAPTAFSVLDEASAARLVRALFPRYYKLGIAAASVGLMGAAVATTTASESFSIWLATDCLLAAIVATNGYALRLVPRINAARDNATEGERFFRLHRRSVALNAVSLLMTVGALIAVLLAVAPNIR